MRKPHPLRTGELAVIAVCLFARSADAQTSTSARLAEKLATFMSAQGLQAFAAQNPTEPNRYVAVLFYPDSQLLVVGGQPTLPALAQHQFEQRQYADLYSTLHQSVAADSKLFVHDMQADGLRANPKDSADIVYDQVTHQMVFDGNPRKRRQSDEEYVREFSRADAKYSELLSILLNASGEASAAATVR